MDVSEKKYVEKRLLNMFLTEDEVLMGEISARSLTLLIFAVGWALCGWQQPEHDSLISMLSLSPLNV